MVNLGKLKRESMSDKASQEDEEETMEEEPVVKTREPLSGNKTLITYAYLHIKTSENHFLWVASLIFENFSLPGLV